MPLDMSQFSDEQLESLAKGDYSTLSDAQLQQLSDYHDEQSRPVEAQPTAGEKLLGGLGTGAAMVAEVPRAVGQFAKENPVVAGGAAYLAKDWAKAKAAQGAHAVKNLALKGLQGGRGAVQAAAGAISPEMLGLGGTVGTVAAVPGAMMYGDYKNWQQQTPDQQRQSAMDALSGQAPGQAW